MRSRSNNVEINLQDTYTMYMYDIYLISIMIHDNYEINITHVHGVCIMYMYHDSRSIILGVVPPNGMRRQIAITNTIAILILSIIPPKCCTGETTIYSYSSSLNQ